MVKFILALSGPAFIFTAYGQCVHCSSMEEALVDPLKVRSLDLSGQGYYEFPYSINACEHLEHLDLSQNYLNEINFQDLHLPALKHLDLSNNPGFNTLQMDGISESMPELVVIDLSHNSVRYISPEIGSLRNLEELHVKDNSISALPQQILEINSLRKIDVSQNHLTNSGFNLSHLWNIEYVDISDNPELKLSAIGFSLALNDHLRYLCVTPNDEEKSLPASFGELCVNELAIKNASVELFNGRIVKNDCIKSITFEKCEFRDPGKIIAWINRFDSLETLVLRQMSVPVGISELRNLSELVLDDCNFENKSELREIRPSIKITAINCNIQEEGYVGNAKRATGYIDPYMLSAEMKNNDVTPICTVQSEIFVHEAGEEKVIALNHSSYEIPSNAFLTKSGELYQGTVNIQIKEYFDPVTSALAGLPMVYNDGTDRLFSSSGMFDFRAYDADGEELLPNPENKIEVSIDDLQPGEATDLYIYDDEASNWVMLDDPVSSNYDQMKRNLVDSLNGLDDSDLVFTNRIPIILSLDFKKRKYDPTSIKFEYVSPSIRKAFNLDGSKYYLKNADQRFLCHKEWKIDTILSTELYETLREIRRDQKMLDNRWKNRKRYTYAYRPRLIRDLAITPNLENDNFTMAFWYKDKHIVIPVYNEISGSAERVQMKERRNYRIYERDRRLALKESKRVDKLEAIFIAEEARSIRERQVQVLESNAVIGAPPRENLRFALSGFGLLNCDRFARPIPQYYRLDSTAVDEDGNHIRVPSGITNILLDENTYVITDGRTIPAQTNVTSIAMFTISAFEIAVIKGWKRMKDGLLRPKVERISIEGMSDKQIRRTVLNL